MINILTHMFQTNIPRAVAVLSGFLIISSLLLWVTIIDLKYKKIKIWKMYSASSSILLVPFIISLFYNCEKLKNLRYYLFASLFLFAFLLFLNEILNSGKFVGKADVDVIAAIFSQGLMYSFWMGSIQDNFVFSKIIYYWYSVFLYLLIASLIILLIVIFYGIFIVATKKKTLREFVKTTKWPTLGVFVMTSVYSSLVIMVS